MKIKMRGFKGQGQRRDHLTSRLSSSSSSASTRVRGGTVLFLRRIRSVANS